MNRKQVVAAEFMEEDTYWIELKNGYCVPEGLGQVHAIAESTRRAARAKLADVRKCDCAECRR